MTLAADPPTAADQNRVRAEHVDVPVRLLRPLPQAAAAMASNDNCPYPREAVDQGLTGTVVLAVFVATDGKPEKTRLDKTSGFAVLDEAAVRCVEQFARFPVPPGVVASGGYWGRMRFNWSFGSGPTVDVTSGS
jgi:protein TonB